MNEQYSTSVFDFESMRRAIEQLDADLLTSLYADDAQMHIVNRYSRVLAAMTLEVRNGKVVRQVNVEAWDE